MIQIKIATQKNTWEQFVDRYANDALFQRWDWGEVVTSSHQTCLRFRYMQKKTCVAVAQIVIVYAKRGNFLHVRHGPILSKWDARTFRFVISHLKQVAKKYTCVAVRISPRIEKSYRLVSLFRLEKGIPSAIHAMDAEHAWVLDLADDTELLLSHMRKTTRYEVRKGEKMGVSVEIASDMKAIQTFLSLYKETAKRQHFVRHSGIEEEFAIYSKEGNAICITGSFDHRPYASAIILFSGDQAIYHHGASISSSIPVSTVVQWHAICEAKRRGMKEYNFWGIAPDNEPKHPWFGLSAFKKGFGGREVQTMHAYDFPVSWRYIFLYGIEWLRKQQKGYS